MRSLKEPELAWPLFNGSSRNMEVWYGQKVSQRMARHFIFLYIKHSSMNQKIEILLVEDSASDAEMTVNALSQNHLANKLLHVKDGAEALDFLFAEGDYVYRKSDQKPKLILLDL